MNLGGVSPENGFPGNTKSKFWIFCFLLRNFLFPGGWFLNREPMLNFRGVCFFDFLRSLFGVDDELFPPQFSVPDSIRPKAFPAAYGRFHRTFIVLGLAKVDMGLG